MMMSEPLQNPVRALVQVYESPLEAWGGIEAWVNDEQVLKYQMGCPSWAMEYGEKEPVEITDVCPREMLPIVIRYLRNSCKVNEVTIVWYDME